MTGTTHHGRILAVASPAMVRRVAFAVLIAIALGACGYDGDDSGGPPEASASPPTTVEELAEVFDPQLEPMGLRLTRGALIDRSDGGYVPSADGDHLALYVEPLADVDFDTADYVEGIGTVTALVTPQVFDRWEAVQTYDICQEPPADVDDRDAPPPYTQIEIGRAEAAGVDWDTATTGTVIELDRTGAARLIVTPVVRADPAFLAVESTDG